MDSDPDSGLDGGLDGEGESSTSTESPFLKDDEAEALPLWLLENCRSRYNPGTPSGGGLTAENLARIMNEDRSEAGPSSFYHLSLRGSAGLDGGLTVPSNQGQTSRTGSERGPDSEGGPVVPSNQDQPRRPVSESGIDQQGEQMTISLRGHRSQSI